MSLDRAIMLPHESDKEGENTAADADAVGASDRSIGTSVEWPRRSGESFHIPRPQTKTGPNDGKRNEWLVFGVFHLFAS